MPIDTSMYNQGPGTPNPLETYGQAVGVANAIQTNRLLQMSSQVEQGKLDLGNVFSAPGVVNADSTVNYDKALSAAAANPRTAMFVPEILRQSQDANSLVQVPNADGSLSYHSKQNVQASAAGYRQPVNDTQRPTQDVVDGYHDHFEQTKETIKDLLNKPDLSEGDIYNSAADLIGNEKSQVNAHLAASALGTLPRGPDGKVQQDALKPWLQNFYQQAVDRHDKLSAMFGAKSAPQQAPGGMVNQQPTTPAGSGVPAALAPGQATALAGQGTQAAVGADMTFKNMASARSVIPTFEKIKELSEEGVRTGPTQAWKNKVSGQLADLIPGIVPDQEHESSNFQLIKKYMADASNQVGGSSGTGSNEWLNAAQSANPNDKQFPEAVQHVANFMLGRADLAIAKAQSLSRAQGAPGADLPTTWRNNELAFGGLDAQQVYEMRRMSKVEKAQLGARLGKEGIARLIQTKKQLQQLGAIQSGEQQ